jgi:chorismate mutase
MKNLDQIRQELDKIDTQILELISKRLALQPEVAKFKQAN